MHIPLNPHACRVLLAILLISIGRAQAQQIDLNSNGLSDIWEGVFQTSGAAGSSDSDGDGLSNKSECLAATNPFDSNSVPRLSFSSPTSSQVAITMDSALGKRYEWQSTTSLSDSNWVTVTNFVVRSGTTVNLTAPVSSGEKLFRIVISDVDTDGDGLNDWEEYKVGLDPLSNSSNGELDLIGQPLDDFEYAQAKLASQNSLTLVATDPIAVQPDANEVAQNEGTLTVIRGGFPLSALTVNLAGVAPGPGMAVQGVDYQTFPASVNLPAGASSVNVQVKPYTNASRINPAVATLRLMAGLNYSSGMATNASVVIYPSATPKGTGLTGQYFTNASATYSSSVNFNPANLRMTRLDTNVNFTWGTGTTPIVNGGWYCVRWTGQVQPQYSETYFFVANTDDGVKLWVNDQLIIDRWMTKSASDVIGSITLQGGIRYNIKLEYFQATGTASARLYWYSPNQVKQIIPTERLYPGSPGPSSVTSPLAFVGFLGQWFSNIVTGANSPQRYSASPLPPGLNFNPTNGVLSGIPTLAGDFQITLTSSNAIGVGASIVGVTIIETGSSVTRELWTGVSGVNVSDIPLDTPATSTNFIGTLEDGVNIDNYGERIRGYLTAPVTGNYYFWLAASDSAELWIANDGEPANKVLRASVNGAGTGPRQWNVQAKQRSGWLALIAGQRYYIEVLHKAGVSTNDNWAVGWMQDPTGTNFISPGTGVVPGYVLSRHFPLPPSHIPGTLYTANMVAQGTAVSSAVGTATLRVSADENQAVLSYQASGFSTPVTAKHIHSDQYLNQPSQIIFDIDDATPQADGSFVWNIEAAGSLSKADILEILRVGKAYINIHTVNYPAGEIRGNFTLANGTQIFTPPQAPPAWTDDHSNSNAATRFLIQSTFGPSPSDIADVIAMGYEAWIDNQFTIPPSLHLPIVQSKRSPDPTTPWPGNLTFNTWWQQSVTAPDQLRQRLAFALSEIMVVSEVGVLENRANAISAYYDMLLNNAFGNFRELIEAVTLSPAMGLYLDMRANEKGDMATGRHPNENYAREILQLFSTGLYRMWPDGTLVMNSHGELVPTYDQDVIMGFARVFTGWNYYQPNQGNGRLPTNFGPPANYINPMVLVPSRHELGTKLLLDNVVLPQAWGSQADSASTNFDIYCSQDLELAHDSIFYNSSVGPFICRQLIQRLVTSHPSREYLYRVVQKFENNGSGVRGDLKAVIKAILLDYEARSPQMLTSPAFGKQREPLLRVTAAARAFPGPPDLDCTYSQNGNRTITVTAPSAHRLNNGDTVYLTFADASGSAPPTSQNYGLATTPSTTTFTVNAPGLSAATYIQVPNVTISNMVTASIVNTNIIMVFFNGHQLLAGRPVYLSFTSGGASNGVYRVISTTNANMFVVDTPDGTARSTNNCLVPKITGGGYVQNSTNVTVTTPITHGLAPGDSIFIDFVAGQGIDGTYQVVTTPTWTNFTVIAPTAVNRTQNGQIMFPLAAPDLVRSGNVAIRWSTFSVGATDTGASASLSQTPLNSPSVFNFFFPDFKFPGVLAAAGLTTPEFMLTSDTEVMFQMNYLAGGIGLINSGNNTNGLTSFSSNDGDIVMDIGPWMGTNYTSNAGIPALVDTLNSLLMAGQLSPGARSVIIAYVANTTNFPYGNPPTANQRRDRVRAVIHLLLTSPDFTIQR